MVAPENPNCELPTGSEASTVPVAEDGGFMAEEGWYVGTPQTETYPDPAETNEYSDWVVRNATSGFETEAARFETAPMNRTTTFDPGFILGGEGGTAGEKYWTFQESVAAA